MKKLVNGVLSLFLTLVVVLFVAVVNLDENRQDVSGSVANSIVDTNKNNFNEMAPDDQNVLDDEVVAASEEFEVMAIEESNNDIEFENEEQIPMEGDEAADESEEDIPTMFFNSSETFNEDVLFFLINRFEMPYYMAADNNLKLTEYKKMDELIVYYQTVATDELANSYAKELFTDHNGYVELISARQQPTLIQGLEEYDIIEIDEHHVQVKQVYNTTEDGAKHYCAMDFVYDTSLNVWLIDAIQY